MRIFACTAASGTSNRKYLVMVCAMRDDFVTVTFRWPLPKTEDAAHGLLCGQRHGQLHGEGSVCVFADLNDRSRS